MPVVAVKRQTAVRLHYRLVARKIVHVGVAGGESLDRCTLHSLAVGVGGYHVDGAEGGAERDRRDGHQHAEVRMAVARQEVVDGLEFVQHLAIVHHLQDEAVRLSLR